MRGHPETAFSRLLLLALVLALLVMSVGAFTRLSHAGLGCPDWPGCYGRWILPTTGHEELQLRFPDQPLEPAKAWIEMGHRYLAATLGLVILLLAGWGWWLRRHHWVPVGSLGLLLFLVVMQGLFGRWTVTLKLWPQVVTLHLMGGLLVFALLLLTWLRTRRVQQGLPRPPAGHGGLRLLGWTAGVALVGQLLLGGWVSANYAALACPDVPLCRQQWLPPMDWSRGFDLAQAIGPTYLGGQLDNAARTAIHMGHRLGALVTALLLGLLGLVLIRTRTAALRRRGGLLLAALALQLALGVANVAWGFPLWLALAHHGGAVALWAAWLATQEALWPGRRHGD